MSDRMVLRGLVVLASMVLVTRIAAMTLPTDPPQEVASSTPTPSLSQEASAPSLRPTPSTEARSSTTATPSATTEPSITPTPKDVPDIPTPTIGPIPVSPSALPSPLPTSPSIPTPTPLPSICLRPPACGNLEPPVCLKKPLDLICP